MRMDIVRKTIGIAVAIVLLGSMPLSAAQDKPADNMEILREKINASGDYDKDIEAGLKKAVEEFKKTQAW